MHRLAKLSLANRSVVALLTLMIAIFGVVSMTSLKQELLPNISTPQGAIVTTYIGASADIIDKQVSTPIESAVRQQSGLVSSSSTSAANVSTVRASFDYGTSTSKIKELLNSALTSVKLPSNASAKVVVGSFDDVPIIALAVSTKDGKTDALSKILDDVAQTEFASLSGVREVSVSGVIEKRISIKFNNAALASNGLSAQSVITALQSNGFVIPAGSIKDSKGSISVEVGTAIDSLAALKSLPLMGTKTSFSQGTPVTLPNGMVVPGTPSVSTTATAVRLSDVATVSYGNAPVTSISRVNGKEALTVAITKTQDANTVAVSHEVQKQLPEFKAQLGDVTVTTVFDQSPYIERSLTDLAREGGLGLAFAIVVILLFLMSVRSTLVTAISIPTSVLITFMALSSSGYSLNLLTLSSFTIAIGRVVDDSIVVIENINRHLSYGEPKKKAILRAVREVATAVTAATITTVAVFLPITLVGGQVGELFRPFGFTFAVALIASLVVSLTIVPVLAYWFLKNPPVVQHKDAKAEAKWQAEVRHAEEERERKSWLQRGYLPILTFTQKRPVLTLAAGVVVLVLTFGSSALLKTDFIGSSGANSFTIRQTLPAGATLAEQSKAAAKLEAALLDHKEITIVQTSIASAADARVAFGASAGGTTISITTEENVNQSTFQDELKAQFAKDSTLGTLKFGSNSGGSFGSSDTIDIKVTASNDTALEEDIKLVLDAMQGTKNVTDITSSLAEKQRTLQITVDRLAAAKKGLTENTVAALVASSMTSSSIGNVNLDGTSTAIYIVKSSYPTTVAQIKAIKIPTTSGMVSLSTLADVKQVNKPASVSSEKGQRTATVSLTPKGNNLGAITAEVNKRLAKVELPTGTASLGGISQAQADSFAQLGIALLAAIAIVFLVMVATFSSLIQPLILLISIPFAATGAFTLLLLTDTALGVSAIIGMLLLVGIVVTNAIVLIDLINRYRKDGKNIHDAIMDGARQRLRPILMTAIATIFALMPLALGIGGSGGFISQPLAIVVIGGLFSSTILTLVIVPVLYWLVEGRKERKAARRAARA